MINSETIKVYQKEYDELGDKLINSRKYPDKPGGYNNMSNIPINERACIHTKRSILKRKINSLKEYENLAAFGTESQSSETKNDNIVEINERLSKEETYNTQDYKTSLLEWKESLNKRSIELLNEIDKYNQKVESLKIK